MFGIAAVVANTGRAFFRELVNNLMISQVDVVFWELA